MHHIYKTKALVLNNFPIREADKVLILLTEDFGLIRVTAQGIRKNESKLRQSTQDYSFADIALVSGRNGWRLTNAKFDFSIVDQIENKKLFKTFVQSLSLIERLVVGESQDELFFLTFNYSKFLIKKQDFLLEENNDKNFESIFVLNILNILGYIDKKKIENFITNKITREIIESISDFQRKNINKIINQSIKESGL